LEGGTDFSLFVVDRGNVEVLYSKKHNNKVISKVARNIKEGEITKVVQASMDSPRLSTGENFGFQLEVRPSRLHTS
jgi:hypothetical protein